MFKVFSIIVISTLISAPAFAAKLCKVYGISDSPQTLHCSFPEREIHLSCDDGKYFLNTSPVSTAFHMEVETGTVPLVFKTSGMIMTVIMDNPIQAQLAKGKAEVQGTCRTSL